MAKGSITMRVENLQKLLDQVQEIDEKGRKAVKATVRDVKSRAPGWIAQEVTQVYNIKKSEITPSSGKGAKPKKMAGSIQVRGETIEEMTITYSGRLLTPVHFGMTPKTPPAGKSYTLKMQVVKGQKKVIGRYKNTRTPGGPILRALAQYPHGHRQYQGRRRGLHSLPTNEPHPHRHSEVHHHLSAADDNQRQDQREDHDQTPRGDGQATPAQPRPGPRQVGPHQRPPQGHTAAHRTREATQPTRRTTSQENAPQRPSERRTRRPDAPKVL